MFETEAYALGIGEFDEFANIREVCKEPQE